MLRSEQVDYRIADICDHVAEAQIELRRGLKASIRHSLLYNELVSKFECGRVE